MARAAAERPDLAAVVAALGHVVWYLPAPATRPLAELVGRGAAPRRRPTVIVGVTGDATPTPRCGRRACRRASPRSPAPVRARRRPHASSRSPTPTRRCAPWCGRSSALAAEDAPARPHRHLLPTPDPYAGILEQQLAAAGIPANGPSRDASPTASPAAPCSPRWRCPAERWRRDRVLALVSGAPGARRRPTARARPPGRPITRDAGVVQDLDDWRRKLGGRRAARRRAVSRRLDAVDRRVAGVERRRDREIGRHRSAAGEFVDDAGRAVARGRAGAWAGRRKRRGGSERCSTSCSAPATGTIGGPTPSRRAFERVEDALARSPRSTSSNPTPTHAVFVRALTAELDVATRVASVASARAWCTDRSRRPPATTSTRCSCSAAPRACARRPPRGRAAARRGPRARGRRADPAGRPPRTTSTGPSSPRWPRRQPAPARSPSPAATCGATGEALPSRWLLDVRLGPRRRAGATPPTSPTLGDARRSRWCRRSPPALHGRRCTRRSSERDLAGWPRPSTPGRRRSTVHPVARLVGRGLEAAARPAGRRRSPSGTATSPASPSRPPPSGRSRPPASRPGPRAASATSSAHVLGLADRDDPERVVDLSPLDRGSGVHAVLERFIGEAIEAGAPEPDEPWTPADHGRAPADRRRGVRRARGAGVAPAARCTGGSTQADLLALLDEFLDADDAHRAATRSRPERVELPFGLDDAAPVAHHAARRPDAASSGASADRVDRTDDGRTPRLRLQDGQGPGKYKDIDDGDPVAGRHHAAARPLRRGRPPAARRRARPRPLLDGRRRPAPRTSATPWTDDRRPASSTCVTAIVDGIEAGVFPAVPGEWNTWRRTHETCTYCDFDRVCPRDRGEQAEAKVDAPAAAAPVRPSTWEVGAVTAPADQATRDLVSRDGPGADAVRRGRRGHGQDHPAGRPHRQPRAARRTCGWPTSPPSRSPRPPPPSSRPASGCTSSSERWPTTSDATERAAGRRRPRRRRPRRHLHAARLRQPAARRVRGRGRAAARGSACSTRCRRSSPTRTGGSASSTGSTTIRPTRRCSPGPRCSASRSSRGTRATPR